MNRNFTLLGALVLAGGSALLWWGLSDPGPFEVSLGLPLGLFAIPIGLATLLYGVTRPDPHVTTVRGLFGNPEENLLEERLRVQQRRRVNPRYLPSPRESVNCAKCYTLIPAQSLACARCGLHRRCQQCGKPLFILAGAVRCGPCTRDEMYCDCPRAAPGVGPGPGRRIGLG